MLYHFEAAEDPNALKVDFIKADLDVALTLTQIARQTNEREKAMRNQHNARKCYDAVLEYLGAASLDRHEQIQIARKLALLKSALFILGESF